MDEKEEMLFHSCLFLVMVRSTGTAIYQKQAVNEQRKACFSLFVTP
jgi:hypothetical protein